MRRIVLVLVATALLVAIAFSGSAFAQDIPPDQDGDPETGCEGIARIAANVQEPQLLPPGVTPPPSGPSPDPTEPAPVPGQEGEDSAIDEVTDAHQCRPVPPATYNPGQSGGQL
jgi:hypothetical protein